MMVLNLSEDEMDFIFDSAENNIDCYIENNFNLVEFLNEKGFEPRNSQMFLKRIEFDTFSSTPSDTDYYNAILLYETLDRDVAPYVASSGAFWTALVHANLDYMTYRWPLDKEDPVKELKEKYLLKWSTTRRNKRHNGLARLWWIVHLTVDKTLDDRYELTKIIMNKQDIMNNVLDTEAFNPLVTRAFGKVLLIHKKAGNELTRNEYRDLMKYIRTLDGSIVLYNFTESELVDKFNKYVEWKRLHI